jgi:hypothetical protein
MAAVACGDDDDDDDATDEATEADDDEDRLSDEEYFAAVDQLEGEIQQAFENFSAGSAKEGLEMNVALNEDERDGLDDLEPPEDLEDVHNDLVEALDVGIDKLQELADDTDEETPFAELQSILSSGEDAFAEFADQLCRLVDLAEEKGIELEFVTCEEAEGA